MTANSQYVSWRGGVFEEGVRRGGSQYGSAIALRSAASRISSGSISGGFRHNNHQALGAASNCGEINMAVTGGGVNSVIDMVACHYRFFARRWRGASADDKQLGNINMVSGSAAVFHITVCGCSPAVCAPAP